MTALRTALTVVGAGLLTSTAHAQFSGAASQLGALYNPGAAPTGIPAISITPSATGQSVTGYHYSNSSYGANTTGSSMGNNAALYPDNHWVADGIPLNVGDNWRWNFALKTNTYMLFPAIDHTPLPNEALEATLWGSNDGGATWNLGTVVEVYELGWDPSSTAIVDDGATRWSFSVPVDIITAVPELNQGSYHSNAGGDYEIDAITQTPAPGALTLLGAGALVATRRRRPRHHRAPTA